MKNVLLLVGMLSVMASCGPNYKQQNVDLQLKNDSLLNAYQMKNDELTAYMADLNEIQTSITDLTQQENLLKSKSEGDLTTDAKTRVLSDLEAIRSALKSNKNKLSSLQSKLKKSNAKIVELEKMIANLNSDLAIRDSSIALLSQSIMDLSNKVDAAQSEIALVKTDNQNKAQEIAEKTSKLNTAYYTIGTYKSLRDKQVISNDGLIVKSKSVSSDFNRNAFTKIDISTTKMIALNGPKEVKLVTNHPSDSYSIVKEDNKVKGIEVIDSDRFWSSSKYLVIAEI